MENKIEIVNLNREDGTPAEQPERAAESKTDRQERIEGWSQEVLRGATALVVGAGAIGNELLKNLALLGFGYALICDMDQIERSNLSRTVLFSEENLGEMKAEVAARRYLEMNVEDTARADVFTGNVCTQLGTGVINHVDVVIGCLDNLQARYEMNRRCSLLGKPYIDAGILGLTANLAVVHSAEDKPCWACMYSQKSANATRSAVRHSCGVGMARMRAAGKMATTQVASAIAAGFQTQEVVKCLHALKNNSMRWTPGMNYVFNGDFNDFGAFKIKRRAGCTDHRRYARVDQTPISCEWTLAQTMDYVEQNYGPGYFLNLENDDIYRVAGFVTWAKCRHCGKPIKLFRSEIELYEDEIYCETCPHTSNGTSEGAENRFYYFNRDNAELQDFTLRRLGVPPLHILEFENEDWEKEPLALEMTADLPALMPHLER